jgi:hypothetical protein
VRIEVARANAIHYRVYNRIYLRRRRQERQEARA